LEHLHCAAGQCAVSLRKDETVKILITGGAGFIGSRLALKLAAAGHAVIVLDNLSPQVHGVGADFPAKINGAVTCVKGDVRDRAVVAALVKDAEAIVNLAAETGTGQSMYAVEHYDRVNTGGTALLFDILVNERPEALKKIVVASSRAIYGEGQYACATHGTIYPAARTAQAMTVGQFEPVCPHCGEIVAVEPTKEEAPFAPSSFYGLTKQMQEQMTMLFAQALKLDAFALRYQNVYGPGQSLANPYTGILAVFSNLARKGAPIAVFEDGMESRDFVFVDDVVDATALALSPEATGIHALNIGSGVRTSVLDVAKRVNEHFGVASDIRVTGDFRVGDIRHNVADLTRARALIGFEPKVDFGKGLTSFLTWATSQQAAGSGYEKSLQELAERGLMGRGQQ
jgi:dTDP-L-rhamnose 4-epimerase